MTQAPSIKEALELKPCPFCGGQPAFGQGGEPEHVTIGCNNDGCLVQLYVVSDTEPNAVEAWNTHATLQPDGERREAIARMIRNELLSLNLGCGEDVNIHDAIAIMREDSDVHIASELISDVSDWAAGAILASGLVQDEAG